MTKGYVLIRLLPGLEADAIQQIRVIPGVEDIVLCFGSWDAVVQVEGTTLNALSRLVIGQIRGIRGVQATETLVQADL